MIFKIIIVIYTFLLLLLFGIVDLTNTKLSIKSALISILVMAVYIILIVIASKI